MSTTFVLLLTLLTLGTSSSSSYPSTTAFLFHHGDNNSARGGRTALILGQHHQQEQRRRRRRQQQQRNYDSSPSSSECLLPLAAAPTASSEERGGGNEEVEIGLNVELAKKMLVESDCVCFDVDSTVLREEGPDSLAEYLGVGDRVAELTVRAMEGSMDYEESFREMMNFIRPSKSQIERYMSEYPPQLTDGVDELIGKLQRSGKDVHLVSGGFRIMIEPVLPRLKIPESNLIANTLFFDEGTPEGEYAGYDETEPTCRNMGKPEALLSLRARHGYKNMVMIGDGANDIEAKPPASAFICFGGVAVREPVRDGSDWYVTDFRDITRVVERELLQQAK